MKETLKELVRSRRQVAATVCKLAFSSAVALMIPYIFAPEASHPDSLTQQISVGAGVILFLSAILKGAELIDMSQTIHRIRWTIENESQWRPDMEKFLHNLPWPTEWVSRAKFAEDRVTFQLSDHECRFPRVVRARMATGGSRNKCRVTGLEVILEEGTRTREKRFFDFVDFCTNTAAGTLLCVKDSTFHAHDHGKANGIPFTADEQKQLCKSIADFSKL